MKSKFKSTFSVIDDSPREACGVIGIFMPNENVAKNLFFWPFCPAA